MSGIGEIVYTVLLGWVRGLVDWFWSLLGGGGGAGFLQWFLSGWKVWLLVLLVGGLVIDWITWLIRWRPYRLLLGRPKGLAGAAGDGEAWDSGVGYYENETAADEEDTQWAETTFSTLSEVDPNWADTFVSSGEGDLLYDPDFIPQQLTQSERIAAAAEEFWAGGEYVPVTGAPMAGASGDEADAPQGEWVEPATMEAYDEAPDGDGEAWAGEAYDGAEMVAGGEEESGWPQVEPEALDAGEDAPDAQDEPIAQAYSDDDDDDDAPDAQAWLDDGPGAEASDDQTEEAAMRQDQEEQMMYGRPGLWPGQIPFAGQDSAQAEAPMQAPDAAEPYDPLFNPQAPVEDAPSPAPRRRRRRLHAQTDAVWQPDDAVANAPKAPAPEDTGDVPDWVRDDSPYRRPREGGQPAAHRAQRRPAPPAPSLEDTRPSRVVRPASEPPMPPPRQRRDRKRREDVKTVTGKPARPRGLRRFTSTQDDPIAGLPPLDLTNPFLPPVRPPRRNRDE